MVQRHTPQGLRGRVLAVDDEPISRELLAAILEPQGFEVQTAVHGGAALAAFHMTPFDAILTDFQMPGMSGLELIAEVRKTNPTIPIALITGIADTLAPETVAQSRIDRVFAKPVQVHELLQWVDTLFSRRDDHTRLGRWDLPLLVT